MEMYDMDYKTTQTRSFHILYGDDCSDASEIDSDLESENSEYSYETMHSDDESQSSGLFTIPEETELDILSRGSCEFDLSERSDLSLIATQRRSLDDYLKRDARRLESNNPEDDEAEEVIAASASKSRNAEEICPQWSFASFAADEAKSLTTSSSSDSFHKSLNSHATDNTTSVDSSSKNGSNRLARLKLRRTLSTSKLEETMEAADLSPASFQKDLVNALKCIDSIEMSLLRSPEFSRATDRSRKARNNLLSVISSSKNALMIPQE